MEENKCECFKAIMEFSKCIFLVVLHFFKAIQP